MTVREIGEFGLISRLTRDLAGSGDRIVHGVGDDTAVLDVGDGCLLLATCDVQIEGIHFTQRGFSPEQIGYRAAAVNLSDIAAMGGTPTFALVSLAVPSSTKVELLDGIYVGLRKGFEKWGVRIVGGNTAELPERIAIDVTLLGEVTSENLLLRSGAESGDMVCVTGDLGASAAGLKLLQDPSISVSEAIRNEAFSAHRAPTPRIAEGKYLGNTTGVAACIDVSDGLLGDAAHIAEKSGVSVCIDMEKMPMSAAARIAEAAGIDTDLLVLRGGEDYELLFTVRPEAVENVLAGLERETGTHAAIIGEIRDGPVAVTVKRAGQPIDPPGGAFDHFRYK
ncbi:MAG: thiamine-phosphate kinase [Deltaproteobacteria bacterium]|nr:thiamine-phosphate kinase [Deltaproteobacteria bacterium]